MFSVTTVKIRVFSYRALTQVIVLIEENGCFSARNTILAQVQHQGSEGEEARAGFAAKGITLFDAQLHFRKDYYKATPIGRTAVELEPNGKASAELRAAYSEAKQLSGFTTKHVSEVA